MLNRIRSGEFSFPPSKEKSLSPELQALIRCMLKPASGLTRKAHELHSNSKYKANATLRDLMNDSYIPVCSWTERGYQRIPAMKGGQPYWESADLRAGWRPRRRPNTEERITLDEAKLHPWVIKGDAYVAPSESLPAKIDWEKAPASQQNSPSPAVCVDLQSETSLAARAKRPFFLTGRAF